MNEGRYTQKISSSFAQTNIVLVINFISIIVLLLLASQIGNRMWMALKSDDHFYIFPEGEEVDREKYTFRSMMSFFILLNMMVPLDLAFLIIVSKLVFTVFIENDARMYSEEYSFEEGEVVGCSVKNIDMHEDFVKINHIFCDKTGTLTKNKLIFHSIAFTNNRVYSLSQEERDNNNFSLMSSAILNQMEKDDDFDKFWKCICLCHQVSRIQLSLSSIDVSKE
mmetsp:Transcript_23944/g.36669  ORF Transcript_23944/g.36669 Transcript_23944/m.36669 type:complete len:223 (+) Transcript_23944:802-1470(+)